MRRADGHPVFLGEFFKPDDEVVILGVVAKARGLRGEVAFYPLSGQPEVFGHYRAVRIGDGQGRFSHPVAVASSRVIKDAVAFRLEGSENRDQAEQLVGYAVALDAHDLPELSDDEYYWCQLVGLDVYDTGMNHLGKVEALFDNGAHDVLVVTGENGKEILLPMVRQIIRRTMVESQPVLLVEPLSGLLDVNLDVGGKRATA
ncbi:MAG: ribosome maturation factor RimM [Desulfobulbaceae bacterium]|jgi:16S rRNA processing protein RimM|nr:ribosome maturation factor RimM [Desulfobulbaceae bacterium]